MTVDRYFQIYGAENVKLNQNFELCYGNNNSERLTPCTEIQDPNIKVCIVDNNNISVNRLLFLPQDYNDIVVTHPVSHDVIRLNIPGKSAFLEFGSPISNKQYKHDAMNTLMMESSDRRDHIYLSTVGDINDAGWAVYWAPIQTLGKVLHARMIPYKTIYQGEIPDLSDAQVLASKFEKIF